MAQRETAYQIIARQAERIRKLEELLRSYEYQPESQDNTTTQVVTDKSNAQTSPKVTAITFLEKLFSIRREYARDEISRLARDNGFSSDELFQVAQPLFNTSIDVFTELTTTGKTYWVWRAKPGWPK